MNKKHLKRLAEILGLPLRVLEAGIDTLTKELEAEEAKAEQTEESDKASDEDLDNHPAGNDSAAIAPGEVTSDKFDDTTTLHSNTTDSAPAEEVKE